MNTTDMLTIPYNSSDQANRSPITSPSDDNPPNRTKNNINICCTESLSLNKHNKSPNELTIRFDGSTHIILRPNVIVRGSVYLKVAQPVQASQIRIKFRAEEMAMVKVQENGLESKIERIDQVVTSYFNVEVKLWGTEPSAYLFSSWSTIDVGEYEYPFALKFPNVNFPPSTDEPAGFHIRYIWSAHLDGPSFHPGLRSKDTITPYRPIICSPPRERWAMSMTPRSTAINMSILFLSKTFCPDDNARLWLMMDDVPSHYTIKSVSYKFNKCHNGQIRLQKGIARKNKVVTILQSSVPVPSYGSSRIPISFHIPTRLVSPSFKSRHLCVYYEMVFTMQFLDNKGLLRSSDFIAPIGITNLSNDHLLHIPNLTSVQSYLNSKEAPCFFDPALNAPPSAPFVGSDSGHTPQTPPINAPPSYFALPDLPAQFIRKDREERTVFTSRLIRPGMAPDLGDPIVINMEHKDCDW